MASLLLPTFRPDGHTLTALLVVICFSAGLNVYATVAMLGILARAHVVALPASLGLVESWAVIAVCAVLFLVEFVGDKIPVFDLVWNALQTFVRVPVAAFRVAIFIAQKFPRYSHISTATALRMLKDMTFDHSEASEAFGYSPVPFIPFQTYPNTP